MSIDVWIDADIVCIRFARRSGDNGHVQSPARAGSPRPHPSVLPAVAAAGNAAASVVAATAARRFSSDAGACETTGPIAGAVAAGHPVVLPPMRFIRWSRFLRPVSPGRRAITWHGITARKPSEIHRLQARSSNYCFSRTRAPARGVRGGRAAQRRRLPRRGRAAIQSAQFRAQAHVRAGTATCISRMARPAYAHAAAARLHFYFDPAKLDSGAGDRGYGILCLRGCSFEDATPWDTAPKLKSCGRQRRVRKIGPILTLLASCSARAHVRLGRRDVHRSRPSSEAASPRGKGDERSSPLYIEKHLRSAYRSTRSRAARTPEPVLFPPGPSSNSFGMPPHRCPDPPPHGVRQAAPGQSTRSRRTEIGTGVGSQQHQLIYRRIPQGRLAPRPLELSPEHRLAAAREGQPPGAGRWMSEIAQAPRGAGACA